jgi:tetratricopeptide (TPR) repeat protein
MWLIGTFSNFDHTTNYDGAEIKKSLKDEPGILGKWVRIGQNGPIAMEFKENGLVEADFGNDQTIDVISGYEIRNDTVIFIDKEGLMCKENGKYLFFVTDYYLGFDLIEDDCGGRIKSTIGYWAKPEFNSMLEKLEKVISGTPKPELFLARARLNMAIGNSMKAKSDFDEYLKHDTSDASVYINRAGTRFPADLEGVVLDCNMAISLEPNNKNAYFLRGLANYELGKKEQGCNDFSKAIELGFSVLRMAEQERCAEFWDKN